MSYNPSPPGGKTENPDPPPNELKLESWGEIAAYLRRDIRTVQRWEKEAGLPVRRLVIGKQGQVYAYRSELDRWILQRQPRTAPDEPGPDAEPLADRSYLRLWRFWKPALAILLLVAAAIDVYVQRWPSFIFGATTPRPVATRLLLFVRPFTSASGEKDFVQGLTYELITRLGRVSPGSIGVFAATTSEELGGKTIRELKQTLKADFVLEGSVRRSNEQLRIDIDLVSTADQIPTWTSSYTGNLRNVLAFQDEVAADVANHIIPAFPPLTPSESTANQTTRGVSGLHNRQDSIDSRPIDPQVYQAYVSGRVYLLDRDFPRSMQAFERALQIDPHYPPALAALATSVLLLGEAPNDALPPSQSFPKARQYAYDALSHDQSLSDGYCVLANIAQDYDHNLTEAERLYKKAIELDPRNVTALKWYGDYLLVSNRLTEASAQIDKALELDPASPLLNTAKAEVKYYSRDFDAALAQAQRTVSQYPDFILARFWLGSIYRQKKMYPQAIRQFDELHQRYPENSALLMAYGHALSLSGDRAGAQKVLDDMLTKAHTRYIPSTYLAGMYASLGDLDQTFHWLDQAYAEKNDRLIYLGVDPIADPLRGDPRFAALMKKVGRP